MPDFRTQEQRLRDDPDAPWNRCEPMPDAFNDRVEAHRAHPESLGWWEPVREDPSLPQDQMWFAGDVELFTGQPTRQRDRSKLGWTVALMVLGALLVVYLERVFG